MPLVQALNWFMLLFCRVLDSFKAVKAALENYYMFVQNFFLWILLIVVEIIEIMTLTEVKSCS